MAQIAPTNLLHSTVQVNSTDYEDTPVSPSSSSSSQNPSWTFVNTIHRSKPPPSATMGLEEYVLLSKQQAETAASSVTTSSSPSRTSTPPNAPITPPRANGAALAPDRGTKVETSNYGPLPPLAARAWASADRASGQSTVPHHVPAASNPKSAPVPAFSAPAQKQQYASVPAAAPVTPVTTSTPRLNIPDDTSDVDERRSSVYLPMDDPRNASPVDSTWPFQSARLSAVQHQNIDELMALRSPSQINPIYGLPPQGDAAEPYRDARDYPYAAASQYVAHKASPPTQYSEGFDGYDESGRGTGMAHSKGPAPARPFYRTVSSSVSYGKGAGLRGSTSSRDHTNSLYAPRPSVLRQRMDSSQAWLIYYFAFNLGLTIYNKRVLQGFPFPWTLTGIHTLCGAFGSQAALSYRFFTPSRLSSRENLTLVAFSVLYTVNIAVSNLSLHLVTVPFHQVVRATTPLFTIALSIMYFGKTYSSRTYAALFIVVAGVGFSTYGDYGWTTWGLFLTLLGTLLAAMKTVVTNAIQVGRLKLHPLDLLMRMSPLAFVQCVMYSWWSGEMSRVREYGATEMTRGKAGALLVNGIIAFGLNVVSFTANKKTSALTMTVAANVKQVLTIVLAVFIFDLVITPTNLLGISLTLLGGAYYAKIEFENKKKGAGGNKVPLVASPLVGVVADGEKVMRE